MTEVIRFRPRGEDWNKNLHDYVDAAKALPFIASSSIVWDNPAWDLTGLAKPERAGVKATVRFGDDASKDSSLSGWFGAFARAYVAFKIGEEFGIKRQVGKYTKPVKSMRVLARIMAEHGVSDPAEITPALLDATVDHFRAQGGKEYGIEQRAKALEWVAQALNASGILRSPFDWSSGKKNFHYESRINQYNDDRNFTKDEIEAVAEAFVKAKTPRQQVVTGVLALLCCVPARISELLELPVDCDVVLDPGDGYQSGLRWWPKKGGAPQIKFVPKAMVPVAQEALARIKRHTESARRLARAVMDEEATLEEKPDGWPNHPGTKKLPFDQLLMISHTYGITGKLAPKPDSIELITYHQIMSALQGLDGASTIFEEMDIRLSDGSPLLVNTHKPRHYLNTIANKASVPQADIALWSGRKNIQQNSAYDHETARELLDRLKTARGAESLVPIPMDDQSAFDVAQIKETAHTTQFGWCAQSLRQSPCQMFGECLNCTHLVCIKGADGKLANIKRELERERQLRTKAKERMAGGLKVSLRWMEIFDRKISRLEQLVSILENDDVVDGSPIFIREIDQLLQFDPVAPGKSIAATKMLSSKSEEPHEDKS